MSKFIPTASEIKDSDSSTPVIVAIAIPETYQDDDIDINVAPTLQGYQDNSAEAQNRAVAHQTRIGTDIGRAHSQQERQNNKRAEYYSRFKSSAETARIANANDIAKRRDREGLEVKEDLYFDANAFEKMEVEKIRKEKEADFAKCNKKKGYDVEEYDVANYAGNEYDKNGYEYKSVYD